MSQEITPTRPPTSGEITLRNRFNESLADQDTLMGKVAGRLLTVELAIPGLYATVLKFIRGEEPPSSSTRRFTSPTAAGCWRSL